MSSWGYARICLELQRVSLTSLVKWVSHRSERWRQTASCFFVVIQKWRSFGSRWPNCLKSSTSRRRKWDYFKRSWGKTLHDLWFWREMMADVLDVLVDILKYLMCYMFLLIFWYGWCVRCSCWYSDMADVLDVIVNILIWLICWMFLLIFCTTALFFSSFFFFLILVSSTWRWVCEDWGP